MAQRNKLPGTIEIEQIRVEVPACPACGRNHTVALKRPYHTHNCSSGDATIHISVSASSGQYVVSVSITLKDGSTREITKDCSISTV